MDLRPGKHLYVRILAGFQAHVLCGRHFEPQKLKGQRRWCCRTSALRSVQSLEDLSRSKFQNKKWRSCHRRASLLTSRNIAQGTQNFNHGLSRRSKAKAEWTRRKAAWLPRRHTRFPASLRRQKARPVRRSPFFGEGGLLTVTLRGSHFAYLQCLGQPCQKQPSTNMDSAVWLRRSRALRAR
jgi:hypothetical protein